MDFESWNIQLTDNGPFWMRIFASGVILSAVYALTLYRRVVFGVIENPKLASSWRDPRPQFSDVGPAHLSYPAAARSVSAGVMAPLDGGTFQLSRPVTGSEALDTVSKLAALARK